MSTLCFFLIQPQPPRSTLFPYTTLFRSEQSGQIDTVGFEMYMKLLEQTVRELKGEELEDDVRATVNLRVDLKIDSGDVTDMNQRLMLYRKVAAAGRDEGSDRVLEGGADREG